MKTVPNQKVVITADSPISGQFAKVEMTSFRQACSLFKKKATPILFVELTGNVEGWQTALSSSFFTQTYKISRDAYNAAVQELIELKFLIQMGESNTYKMYRTPQDGALQEIPATKRMKSLQEIPTTTLQEIPTRALQEIPTTSCRKSLQEIDKHIPNKKEIDKKPIEDIHPSEFLEEEAKTFKGGIDSVMQLLRKGKTEEWIFAAMTLFEKKKKKKSEGMGLLFLPSFQVEVDKVLQEREENKAHSRIINAAIYDESLNSGPARTIIIKKSEPRKPDEIDMNTLFTKEEWDRVEGPLNKF